MLLPALASLLDRDLRALTREVEAYPDERQLWQPVPGMANTAGTLALHLAGNVRHYVGARLGDTGYVRDRAAEFSRRDVPREEILAEIEAARSEVARTVAAVEGRKLPTWFPEVVVELHVGTEEFLLHLLTHFGYHLGQIDTHRRIVTGHASNVGAIRVAELKSARPAR
ncbi:MAG TPA: DinB family protein [Gemmatimonadales bacterium]|jgi:hypothetical protein